MLLFWTQWVFQWGYGRDMGVRPTIKGCIFITFYGMHWQTAHTKWFWQLWKCLHLFDFFFFLLSVFLFPIVLIAARHWLPLLPWLSHMLSAARPPNDRRACKLVCQFWNRELPVKCRHTNTHKMKLCGVKDGGAEWVTDGSTVSLFTH